ncbi:hypothetical protein L6452_07894 [Arctium lappa]|uniref:Uncharacterized protein n=1 Tax=Arctium lappa TaxID=4217 RepID=A0ACB9EMA8_ARCLA|nr:hypothetical protein L6452_07894 [Arctium lappa]
MMMMMIMIAAYVNSITTPIKSWFQKHSSTPPHDHHNTPPNITIKELTVNCARVDCIVCLSEVVSGERLAMLERCGHGYHVECLEAWLKDHPNCPLCRTPVSGSDQDTTRNQSLYLKKFYDIVTCYGTGALKVVAGWLTNSFTQGLQSTLSESCNYL